MLAVSRALESKTDGDVRDGDVDAWKRQRQQSTVVFSMIQQGRKEKVGSIEREGRESHFHILRG